VSIIYSRLKNKYSLTGQASGIRNVADLKHCHKSLKMGKTYFLPKSVKQIIALLLLIQACYTLSAQGKILVESVNDSCATIRIVSMSNACATFPDTHIKVVASNNVIYESYIGNVATSNPIQIKYNSHPGQEIPLSCHITYHGWFLGTENCNYSVDISDIVKLSSFSAPNNFNATNNLYGNKIDITWEKNSACNDNSLLYELKCNDTVIATLPGNARSYTHSCSTGISNTYTIRTKHKTSGTYSTEASITGSTFNIDFNTRETGSGYIKLAWNVPIEATGVIGYTIERLTQDGSIDRKYDINQRTTNGFQDDDVALIAGYKYTYLLKAIGNTTIFGELIAKTPNNGTISGTVLTNTSHGVNRVKIIAQRTDTISGDTTRTYYAYSNNAGDYSISNIYYNKESEFKVYPELESHSFEPDTRNATLNVDNHILSQINFTDTSSYTVLGRVLLGGEDSCTIEGVKIIVNGTFLGIVTDSLGEFSVALTEADNYTFKPLLEEHLFEPSEFTCYVGDDTSGITFYDTTKYSFIGSLLGSCNTFIGTYSIRLTSESSSNCVDTIIESDAEGMFTALIPAGTYTAEVISFASIDENYIPSLSVVSSFEHHSIDLSTGNDTLNLLYHLPLRVSMDGANDSTCGEHPVPYFEQGKLYNLVFSIEEGYADTYCKADSGYIVLRQNLTSESELQLDTVYFKDGIDTIWMSVGAPNLVGNHYKYFSAIVHVGNQSDTIEMTEVLVLGNRKRGANFTTVSPEIPMYILHDPVGDGSYAYIEENSTITHTSRISYMTSSELNLWVTLKLGIMASIGEGVSFDVGFWAQGTVGLKWGGSQTWNNETVTTLTTTERYETSSSEEYVGNDGDVFIGAAMNLTYAVCDILSYDFNTCSVAQSTGLQMSPNGFATTFMYTQKHIKEVLIPQLEGIRESFEREGYADSVSRYNAYIQNWKEIIEENKNNIETGKFQENISFSSGSSYESSEETSTMQSHSYDFLFFIEPSVAAEAGIEVAGNGLTAGGGYTFRYESNVGQSNDTTNSTTIGYVLKDNDDGDYFSVDRYTDPIYGTPVFKLVGGNSSCPWEKVSQKREGVQIIADRYNISVDSADGEAVFILKLGNLTENDEEREYELVFDQTSNPYGASVTIGGSPAIGGMPIPYTIPSLQEVFTTITVKKGPLASTYNGLCFILRSACDDQFEKRVYLNVEFPTSCSGIALNVAEHTFVNADMNNVLNVKLNGYQKDALQKIYIQISDADKNVWSIIETIEPESLNADETEVQVNFENYKDGLYNIRGTVVCTEDNSFSKVISVVVDRRKPQLLGYPEPSSEFYDPETGSIAAYFNENVLCDSLRPENISLINSRTKASIDFEWGCYENRLVIMPVADEMLKDKDVIRVALTGVADESMNYLNDTIKWSFTIINPEKLSNDSILDSDKDGVRNFADNCKFMFNPRQLDMDNDGIGDISDNDIDGDNVENSKDNCPILSNADQQDMDNDGIGDEGDIDIDADGISNDFDNCIYFANEDQSDTDGDGIGNACDEDIDNDGYMNEGDNCPYKANAGQEDADNDGVGDACDDSITSITIKNMLPEGLSAYSFPNPITNELKLTINTNIQGKAVIEVTDISGKNIYFKTKKNIVYGKNIVYINSKSWAEGTYVYTIKIRDYIITDKVVK